MPVRPVSRQAVVIKNVNQYRGKDALRCAEPSSRALKNRMAIREAVDAPVHVDTEFYSGVKVSCRPDPHDVRHEAADQGWAILRREIKMCKKIHR